MDTDRKKYRPPKWDVKDYLEEVKPKHEETYQQINLQATLTWGMTHTQLYRARKLAGVIEYILNGTEVRDPSTKKKMVKKRTCFAMLIWRKKGFT